MRQPGFGVVTFVVTALAVVGISAQLLRPYVPAIGENAMDRETEPFLRAGRLHTIPWQRYGAEALKKARQSNRPVLLYIGVTPSRIGRDFDDAFRDPDVARLVTSRFVPARIDGLEHPEWLSAFFPISRLKLRFQPDAQIWFLDGNGEPFDALTRASSAPLPTQIGLLTTLRTTLDRYASIPSEGNTSDAAEIQDADLRRLALSSSQSQVDLNGYRLGLHPLVDPIGGGFPIEGLRQPRSHVHRFLLSVGDQATARQALDPLLRSPQRDLVEGGFFHVSMGANPWYVEFDKWTSETAGMAHTLALAYCLLGDPMYRNAAIECLDALLGPLMGEKFLTAGEVGVTYGRDRSERHSFPPRRLAELLSQDEVNWAVENLGLDLARNPQAVPYLRTDSDATERMRVLTKLGVRPPRAERAKEGYAGIHLGAMARALQAARLLGDTNRLRILSRRFAQTSDAFVTRAGYVRHVANEGQAPGVLGDHLAYVDAKLQHFLATGQNLSLAEGRRALLKTIRRFRTAPGQFVISPSTAGEGRPPAVPELADNGRESCTAQAIRLLLAYGRLLANKPDGNEFLSEGYAALYRYGGIAFDGGPSTAGFFAAAAEAADDNYAVCAGPNALRMAEMLARRCPARLVIPAIGNVRRDVANRGPGIYLVLRGAVRGPYQPEQAVRLLGSTLETTR
jgi:uncharacterized protein YyaL (SSP411 family)